MSDLTNYQQQLSFIKTTDRGRLIALLKQVRQNQSSPKHLNNYLQKLKTLTDQSLKQVKLRSNNRPAVNYPELPVCDKLETLQQTINQHQVTIVAGETGSGKSTQLPKICLDSGLGDRGLIGHTQPRRLAARSVASRIAEELNTNVGDQVGFKIRFTDQTAEQTYIKLMTDGILLAEIQKDPFLCQYQTIIIDEAHERSLNIDFLLGYLKQLLSKRPDLKVIITSATIDYERFSKHFNQAPIIEVSGRTYPVEIRYECYEDYIDNISQPEKILTAIEELAADSSGDILIFLATEGEIFEALQYLKKADLKHTEILPLFSRLSQADQNKIFHPQAYRRIILSTNVAETSLTVPGIKYVIDTGFVRISRYNYRTKVQRLPIEPISQASANQRAGRCGRTSPGICIRLYSEEDFQSRRFYTDPEILRTSLASVILQMALLKIGHIQDFPFIEPPQHKLIEDGYKLLFELQAIDHKRQLTPTGKQLSQFQIDPKYARMVVESTKQNCTEAILIITSFLSIQDPRERPRDFQQKADQAHAVFKDKTSDYLSILKLWYTFAQQANTTSTNKLIKFCRDHFLAYKRMREWQDIYQQLKQTLKQFSNQHSCSTEVTDEQIHRALLSGLLSNIGFNDEDKQYVGPRGIRFYLFPGSALFKKTPKWVMASELVETSKLYARNIGQIAPEWVEKSAQHLIKKSYQEPHWSKKARNVMAYETVSLYGLPLISNRRVAYANIDPKLSREIFIRSALVEGQMDTQADFFHANLALLEDIENLEDKARRRDILIDDETLFHYYDTLIDTGVVNQVTFEQWYKTLTPKQQDKLYFQKNDLMQHQAQQITQTAFPESLTINNYHLPLSYHFDPTSHRDGITVTIPVIILHQINSQALDWLVPGLIEDKIISLIRALPKNIRKYCLPVPQYAKAILQSIHFDRSQNLFMLLSSELTRITGINIGAETLKNLSIDNHLMMNINVTDKNGDIIESSRDLYHLQQTIDKPDLKPHPAKKQPKQYQSWTFDDLSAESTIEQSGIQISVYPCLKPAENGVIVSHDSCSEQAAWQHQQAIRMLLKYRCYPQLNNLSKWVANWQQLALKSTLVYRQVQWEDELIEAALNKTFPLPEERLLTKRQFNALYEQHIPYLTDNLNIIAQLCQRIFDHYQTLSKKIKRKNIPLDLISLYQSVSQSLEALVYEGFLRQTPYEWLVRIPYYIQALEKRLEKAPRHLVVDRQFVIELEQLHHQLDHRIQTNHLPSTHPDVIHIRWLFKELWLAWYAQDIKTVQSVSVKKINKLITALST